MNSRCHRSYQMWSILMKLSHQNDLVKISALKIQSCDFTSPTPLCMIYFITLANIALFSSIIMRSLH